MFSEEGKKAILRYKQMKYSPKTSIKAKTKLAFWDCHDKPNRNHIDPAGLPPPPLPSPEFCN